MPETGARQDPQRTVSETAETRHGFSLTELDQRL